jgi:hypothetical protein
LFKKCDYFVGVVMVWVEGFEDVVGNFESFSCTYMVTTLDKNVLGSERFSAGLAHCRFFSAHKISMGYL